MGTELALTGASKMVLMNLFAGRSRDTDVEDRLVGHSRGRRGWGELREQL